MEDSGASRDEEGNGLVGALVPPEFQQLGHFPFLDTVECRIEPRTGRMTLPVHLRGAFPDGNATLRCMKGGHANIWTPLNFFRWDKRLGGGQHKGLASPRRGFRAAASAKRLTIDAQGRFVLPAEARAHLGVDTHVIVAGCRDHLELWHPEVWAEEEAAQMDEWDLDAADFQGLDVETGE